MSYSSNPVKLPEGFHDLGEKIEPLGMMETEMEVEEPEKEEIEEEVHYPSLFFAFAPEGLKDLPQVGTATIHFKKVMERTTKEERDGKNVTNYCLELEIHGIKPSGKSEIDTKEIEPDDDDAIEKGLAAASEETSTD